MKQGKTNKCCYSIHERVEKLRDFLNTLHKIIVVKNRSYILFDLNSNCL